LKLDEIESVTSKLNGSNAVSLASLEDQIKKLQDYTSLQIEEKYKQPPPFDPHIIHDAIFTDLSSQMKFDLREIEAKFKVSLQKKTNSIRLLQNKLSKLGQSLQATQADLALMKE
jgi:hypothetical protein